MLYHILDYNSETGVAKGVEASQMGQVVAPSSFHVSLLIDSARAKLNIIPGMTYSFIPENRFYNGTFVRGELDYKSPLPKGR